MLFAVVVVRDHRSAGREGGTDPTPAIRGMPIGSPTKLLELPMTAGGYRPCEKASLLTRCWLRNFGARGQPAACNCAAPSREAVVQATAIRNRSGRSSRRTGVRLIPDLNVEIIESSCCGMAGLRPTARHLSDLDEMADCRFACRQARRCRTRLSPTAPRPASDQGRPGVRPSRRACVAMSLDSAPINQLSPPQRNPFMAELTLDVARKILDVRSPSTEKKLKPLVVTV